MKLTVLAVGKPRERAVMTLAESYIERVTPKGIAALEFADDVKNTTDRARRIEREEAEILKRLRARDRLILLDERGRMFDSVEFSRFVSKQMEASDGRVVFLIGGAFGVSDEIKKRADETVALSKMTMPHELCLLFFAEQIYRAFSIIAGSEYHHI